MSESEQEWRAILMGGIVCLGAFLLADEMNEPLLLLVSGLGGVAPVAWWCIRAIRRAP